jgi:hypothetical protein
MSDSDAIEVDEALYVNEATLELIQRRIEGQVKSSFFRTIGVPIGGAGLLAILYVLFLWIPDNLAGFIEKVPNFQPMLEKSTVEYLNDDETGREFVREQVNLVAQDLIEDAVKVQLQTAETRDFVREQIRARTGEYFTSEAGQKLVSAAVSAVMESPEIRQQITNAIDQALHPAVAGLSIQIDDNLADFVHSVAPIESETINKEDIETLERILDERGPAILESQQTVLLRKTVGAGPRYDINVIDEYFYRLESRFGPLFSHVLLEYRDKQFLGLIEREAFRARLSEVMPILNSAPGEFDYESAWSEVGMLFGPSAQVFIEDNTSVRHALKANVWNEVGKDGAVAVIDGQRRFAGITERSKLLGSLAS